MVDREHIEAAKMTAKILGLTALCLLGVLAVDTFVAHHPTVAISVGLAVLGATTCWLVYRACLEDVRGNFKE
jgi:hypothetical protein